MKIHVWKYRPCWVRGGEYLKRNYCFISRSWDYMLFYSIIIIVISITIYYYYYAHLQFPKFLYVYIALNTIKLLLGLPWWCSGWESACQCREHGFEPWSGKIPHAAERLGPWATTTEPARLEPVLRNKRGRYSERPAHHDEEWPPLAATRESPRTETKTQHSHK